jgi:hypothetical protein
MVIVRSPHVLGAVGVVGINEDNIGELTLASVSPEFFDRIGDVVISPTREETGDWSFAAVVARGRSAI